MKRKEKAFKPSTIVRAYFFTSPSIETFSHAKVIITEDLDHTLYTRELCHTLFTVLPTLL